jgi:hypothetical protein
MVQETYEEIDNCDCADEGEECVCEEGCECVCPECNCIAGGCACGGNCGCGDNHAEDIEEN